MARRRKSAVRSVTALMALAAVCAAMAVSTTVGSAGAAAIPRPEGAGAPVKASGLGTQAALDNPRCRHDDPQYGAYGKFDDTEVGGGPVCVKEWTQGADNGGATATGVTKDAIVVVAVLPNAQVEDPTPPSLRATGAKGTYQDAFYNTLLPYMRFYETWGRDIDLRFFTSTGSDEQAQRADAVAIKAMKPFAAIVVALSPVLESELAKGGIVTQGLSATQESSAAQAPYLWGTADQQVTAVATSDLIGKQLAGKKAQFGGDDVAGKTRTFGVVYPEGNIDYDSFAASMRKNGAPIATFSELPRADTTASQAAAPTVISRLKDAGVTTVVTFLGSPALQALMEQASGQNWFPEWFFTGAGYADIGILVRNYPTDQAAHAFGLSQVFPYAKPDPVYNAQIDVMNWYWGTNVGTTSRRIVAPLTWWLLSGIHAAGPKLTPKTFEQGLFSIPAEGGAADGRVNDTMHGFGTTLGLPYESYSYGGADFSVLWWDPDTTGPSNAVGTVGTGVAWYVDGGTRYRAEDWPTKSFTWFAKDGAVFELPASEVPHLGYAGDCQGCPSTGGAGSPSAPSTTAIRLEAGGTGSSAA